MSTRKRSLVIVTCLKDKFKLEMLCRRVFAFLEPCDIVIIYNERSAKYAEWLEWFNSLKEKILKKFWVRTYSGPELIGIDDYSYCQHDGWVRQQALKLLSYSLVNTLEFVVMDSKNFFMVPCSLDDIHYSNPHSNWRHPRIENYVELCCKLLDYPYNGPDLRLRPNITPYIFKTRFCKRLVKKLSKNNLEFYKFIVDTAMMEHIGPAEFLLYEIFELKSGVRDDVWEQPMPRVSYCTVWLHTLKHSNKPQGLAEYIAKKRDGGILVSGIHKKVDEFLTLKDVEIFLKHLGIDFILPQTVSSPF